KHFHTPDDYLKNPNLIDDIYNQQTADLIKTAGLDFKASLAGFTIEAYDISHLGDTAGVGSRVVFIDGRPDKSKYRRYRLKTAVPDDYQAMAEVIKRRLKKLDDLPDLFLIDGGKGQLSAVKKILDKRKVKTPLIGLVKNPDRLVVWRDQKHSFRIIRIKNQPALLLLQRIRNEAHRFANSYRKIISRLK
ncbi:MAG: excinuclease ABC subunit C, partial [bacterium]|nr:excinuclease ABC subunit C [bacterium]